MNGIDSILCVVDPAALGGSANIDKASRLAQAFDAALELVICSVPPRPAEEDGRLGRDLEKLAAFMRVRCRRVSARLIIGESMHQALSDYIRGGRFDLVIKEAQSTRSFKRKISMSTDGHLIRSCDSPLLLTHSRPWALKPTVLACIDPGHPKDPGAILDHCILQGAQAFARMLGGSLHALHAFCHRLPPALTSGGSISAALSFEPMESEAMERLADVGELAEEYCVSGSRLHVQPAGARDAIVREAVELRADIVVMGAIARKASLVPLLGHTAVRMLDRLPSDILVIRVPAAAR